MLDLKRRADHSLLPRSTPPVWLKLARLASPQKASSQARSKWQPCSRCWALRTRNDGQASGCAVGRTLRIFSRGAHAASRLSLCQTPGGRRRTWLPQPSWIAMPHAA